MSVLRVSYLPCIYIVYRCFLIIPHTSLTNVAIILYMLLNHVQFHGLIGLNLKGVPTQNLLTKALWLQELFSFQKNSIFNQEYFA